jgi:ADP-ribose pyrophosphatase YjhB (NUDIX family)
MKNDHNGQEGRMPLLQVRVKVLVFKYGNLLLSNIPGDKSKRPMDRGKWSLIEGAINPGENLRSALNRLILEKCGWETKNIRLYEFDVSAEGPEAVSQNLEVVFIVDAVKQTLEGHEKVQGLRWFPLTGLPEKSEMTANDGEIVYGIARLLHRGKTLDLEHLPPVFNLKKSGRNGRANTVTESSSLLN